MKFKVKAIGKSGEAYAETIDATDRFEVYRNIRERGDRVVELEEESTKHALSFAFITEFFQKISLDEKVVLVRNLAAMIEAGLTMSRALNVMERQSQNPRMKKVLAAVASDVKRGTSLSVALSNFPTVFPPLLISMVRAGDESGKLAESLRIVAVQMERASNLTKKIKGALIYPGIVLSAMVVIGVLMLVFVVPTLSDTFKGLGAKLPPTTQFIIDASGFLTHHGIISFLIGLVIVSGSIILLRTSSGRKAADWVVLHLPIIRGIVLETNAARTTRTLSSLLSSGVDMVFSLTITRDVLGNHYFKQVLAEAEGSVSKGGSLSEAFAKYPNLYPPLVTEMIAVGEETGRLPGLMKETAEFYEESVDRQTKDLSTVIEPLLMLVIGAGVGFFALSMIAPIYALSNSI